MHVLRYNRARYEQTRFKRESMTIKHLLTEKVAQAMQAAGIDAGMPAAVSPSKQAQFGDFQANGVMGAAKRMKMNPRALAESVVANLDLDGIAAKVELAGPGFINIFLDEAFIASRLNDQHADQGFESLKTKAPETVVIDYSSPNLAKEMHVGHLRSTIIGDALARTLGFLGNTVIRQNHMGDWGTQFGMLIAELEQLGSDGDMVLADLEKFYQQAKAHFDADEAFANTAREYVVKLQSEDPHCIALWQRFIEISVKHSEEIYQTLGVSLSRDDIKPESAYNDALVGIIERLEQQGLIQDDQGAKVAFLQELADKKGNPSPMIVQKSGGGFLYATTDLAAAEYRAKVLNAQRLMYFIDARQSLHMKQVFCLAKKAGFVGEDISMEHLAFGTMMGKDGKPFKTRAGGTVKLADLLDEAVQRASDLLAQRETDLSPEQQAEVARKVGIGAVKYADLSKTRTNDYIFDWDAMLSFEGNTAPYLQYAYTRIQSVFRKAGDINTQASIVINEPSERDLALKLLQFEEVVTVVASDAMPHTLCAYLYDVASAYMSFYEHCPVLKDDVAAAVRDSRLQLCDQTARVLKQGLELLGIDVMQQM